MSEVLKANLCDIEEPIISIVTDDIYQKQGYCREIWVVSKFTVIFSG